MNKKESIMMLNIIVSILLLCTFMMLSIIKNVQILVKGVLCCSAYKIKKTQLFQNTKQKLSSLKLMKATNFPFTVSSRNQFT